MRILSLEQGSNAWLAHRADTLNASEAPAMMGVSPYMTRAELMRLKHDGAGREIDAATQRRFDDGHRAEAAARPIAEEIIGEELYPATVVDDDGRLSASLDGATMSYKVLFEHKLMNGQKTETVEAGECPESDYPQVQQQLLITGAEKCLYAVSDGTKDNFFSCWVYPDEEYQQKLLAGWGQFEKDLAEYEPQETQAEVVGRAMESMPALNLQVEAKVLATNIDSYKAHAIEVFESINTDLQTDQDFADAETAVKFCKDVESRLTAAKDAALAQAEDLYNTLRSIDDVSDSARQKRLALEKLVKARKEARRSEIQQQAVDALRKHYQQINESLSHGIELGCPAGFRADVGQAMKGKRTIKSLIDSADQALADAKLAASAEADRIRANLRAFPELAGEHEHLFPDIKALAGKSPEDFANTVKLRIAEHKEREQEKLEAERERIRAEEEAKAQREQERRKAEEAQREREAAEKDAPTGAEPATEAPTSQESDARSGLGVDQAVEKSGTGEKAQATERWRVSVAFEFDAPADSNGDALADALKARLVAAGFQSVADAVAEKLKEAA